MITILTLVIMRIKCDGTVWHAVLSARDFLIVVSHLPALFEMLHHTSLVW